MDRKKLILIAVGINAGLLVVLFLGLLYREEEVSEGIGLAHQFPKESSALFFDRPSHLAEQELPKPMPFEPPAVPPAEIVHQLPLLISSQNQSAPTLAHPPASAPAPSSSTSSSSQTIEVVVKKGDTLDQIAKAHQVGIDEILKLNQLSSTFLRVGQVLKLPALKKKVVEHLVPQAAQAEYYIVKVGDTPWTIAMKHRMKPDELLRLNHLNNEKAKKLKPGDRLRVK